MGAVKRMASQRAVCSPVYGRPSVAAPLTFKGAACKRRAATEGRPYKPAIQTPHATILGIDVKDYETFHHSYPGYGKRGGRG